MKINALFLVLIFMLPSIVKATHHHHEEDVHHDCHKKTTHLHQKAESDCEVCYFSLSSFNGFSVTLPEFSRIITVDNNINNYINTNTTSIVLTLKRLRAPPYTVCS
ncbi:hypothetical protein [Tenacibaculum sp. 190524A02b]|uniref:Uncharacterized protein n=1 Tax=Tenacibaculum vairaonense TaxID=3137860 RepID=A0ABM9PNG0_9FLAO